MRMETRIDKFGLDLSDINAHTLKIIEIIQEERQNLKQKQRQNLEQKMEQMKNNG